jgi:hypothetical protein
VRTFCRFRCRRHQLLLSFARSDSTPHVSFKLFLRAVLLFCYIKYLSLGLSDLDAVVWRIKALGVAVP